MENPTTHILTQTSGPLSIDAIEVMREAGNVNDVNDAAHLLTYTSVNNHPSLDLDFEAKILREGANHGARLFMFEWLKPVLVLGRSQSMAGIDEQICIQENIPVLKRHTGGSAVLHQHSLNIALVLDVQHAWTRRIDTLYTQFIERVTQALTRVGIFVTVPQSSSASRPTTSKICFEADFGETLLLNGRKVFGCAQRRTKTAVLVHGSLLLGLDIPQHSRVFKVPENRIAQAITCIPDDIDVKALMNALIESFSSRLELIPIQKGDEYGR